MILKNRKLLILTSLLTLLPIPLGLLLWDKFPETMAIHFGFTGQADGFASIPVAVFFPPVLMLVIHWLCILATAFDKGNRNRNQKLQAIVLWIIPLLSNLSSCGIYALALGREFSPVTGSILLMGILFAVIGNYMPKTRMNSTMGIKIPTTYSSEANWNATHRFAGKVWMAGGVLLMLCAFLPNGWAVSIMLGLILILCVIPAVYSWRFYRKELAEGKDVKAGYSSVNPHFRKFSVAFLVVFAIFLLFILFYGDITYTFREDYLLIDTNLYSDHITYYDTIDQVEFREGNVPGLRVGGYGSFRLLMGWFENEEFGTHIRYTYYKPEACVIITKGDSKVVLSGKNYEETEALYQQLLEAIQ